MRNFWEVCLRWNDNNRDEGTFTESTEAADENTAVRQVAESMVGSAEQSIREDEAAAAEFVDDAVRRVEYAMNVADRIRADVANVFSDELFADGCHRDIDMEALGQLLAANRDRIVKR